MRCFNLMSLTTAWVSDQISHWKSPGEPGVAVLLSWLGFIPGAAQQTLELNPPPGRHCRASEQAQAPDLPHFPLLLPWGCVLCWSLRLSCPRSWRRIPGVCRAVGSQTSPWPFPCPSHSPSRALCPCAVPGSPGVGMG